MPTPRTDWGIPGKLLAAYFPGIKKPEERPGNFTGP